MNSCFLIIIILLFCNCNNGNSFGCFGNNGCNDTCDNNLIEPRNTCDCGCDTRHGRESHHNYPTYGNCNTCGCESENN